jgi:DNA-binding NarL/FixJ family response regulator
MMPSMDGFETLRVIRDLAPSLDCKIIMFSNLNKKEDIDKSMKLGASAYLLKANTTPKEAVETIYGLFADVKIVRKDENNTNKTQTNHHNCPHC